MSNVFGHKNEDKSNLSNQWQASSQAKAHHGKMPGEDVEGVDSDEWSDD